MPMTIESLCCVSYSVHIRVWMWRSSPIGRLSVHIQFTIYVDCIIDLENISRNYTYTTNTYIQITHTHTSSVPKLIQNWLSSFVLRTLKMGKGKTRVKWQLPNSLLSITILSKIEAENIEFPWLFGDFST